MSAAGNHIEAMRAEIERLRAELLEYRHYHDEWVVAANIRMVDQNVEIDRLRADLNRWHKDAAAYANVHLSEENDGLIDENARLRADKDALLAAARDVLTAFNGMPIVDRIEDGSDSLDLAVEKLCAAIKASEGKS